MLFRSCSRLQNGEVGRILRICETKICLLMVCFLFLCEDLLVTLLSSVHASSENTVYFKLLVARGYSWHSLLLPNLDVLLLFAADAFVVEIDTVSGIG